MTDVKARLEKLEAAAAGGEKELRAHLLRLYAQTGTMPATVAAYEAETGHPPRASQDFLRGVERLGKQLTANLADMEATIGFPMVNHGDGLITPAPMTEAAWEGARIVG